jgi:hypothetical protein
MSLHVYVTYYQAAGLKGHVQSRRLRQLADLILNLAYIDVKKLNLKIYTNIESEDLRNALAPLTGSRQNCQTGSIICVPSNFLINEQGQFEPHLLTWAHKEAMKKDLNLSTTDTLFLYLEDDAVFTRANLEYFVYHREVLRKIGLIPSFLRAEWSDIHRTWINSDAFERIPNKLSNDLIIGEDIVYREMKNPYCALILLDCELAYEYLRSGSSNVMEAKLKHSFIWDTAATAALGLISENIPPGRNSRMVVAFDKNRMAPLIGAVIRHQGDRYANEVWWRHFRLFENYIDGELPQPKRNPLQKISRLRLEWKVLLRRSWKQVYSKLNGKR